MITKTCKKCGAQMVINYNNFDLFAKYGYWPCDACHLAEMKKQSDKKMGRIVNRIS